MPTPADALINPYPDLPVDAQLGGLFAQAAAAGNRVDATGAQLAAQFAGWESQVSWATTHGVFPLAVGILFFHQYQNVLKGDGSFGAVSFLFRVIAFSAALAGYSYVVKTITYVASGGTEWATHSTIVQPILANAAMGIDQHLPEGITDLLGIANLLMYLVLYVILLLCAGFAYVVALFLTFIQSLLIAIIISVGKLAIALSVVPGVGVGSSWARYLAVVSAWSLVGGCIHGVIIAKSGVLDINHVVIAVREGGWQGIQLAAWYVVWGICTMQIPSITSSIFSGAASAAPGFGTAVAGAFIGARLATRSLASGGRGGVRMLRGNRGRGVGKMGGGAGGGTAGGSNGGATHAGETGGSSGPPAAARAHKSPWASAPQVVRGGGDGAGKTPGRGDHRGDSAPDNRAQPPRVNTPSGPQPKPALSPIHNIGAQRFRQTASPERQAAFLNTSASPSELRPPPPQRQDLQARAAATRSTLRQAYPDAAFDPAHLSPHERAVLDELDARHGRFAGWDRGEQGQGDFDDAAQLAQRRVAATTPDSSSATSTAAAVSGAQPVSPRARRGDSAATAQVSPHRAGAPASPQADALPAEKAKERNTHVVRRDAPHRAAPVTTQSPPSAGHAASSRPNTSHESAHVATAPQAAGENAGPLAGRGVRQPASPLGASTPAERRSVDGRSRSGPPGEADREAGAEAVLDAPPAASAHRVHKSPERV